MLPLRALLAAHGSEQREEVEASKARWAPWPEAAAAGGAAKGEEGEHVLSAALCMSKNIQRVGGRLILCSMHDGNPPAPPASNVELNC